MFKTPNYADTPALFFDPELQRYFSLRWNLLEWAPRRYCVAWDISARARPLSRAHSRTCHSGKWSNTSRTAKYGTCTPSPQQRVEHGYIPRPSAAAVGRFTDGVHPSTADGKAGALSGTRKSDDSAVSWRLPFHRVLAATCVPVAGARCLRGTTHASRPEPLPRRHPSGASHAHPYTRAQSPAAIPLCQNAPTMTIVSGRGSFVRRVPSLFTQPPARMHIQRKYSLSLLSTAYLRAHHSSLRTYVSPPPVVALHRASVRPETVLFAFSSALCVQYYYGLQARNRARRAQHPCVGPAAHFAGGVHTLGEVVSRTGDACRRLWASPPPRACRGINRHPSQRASRIVQIHGMRIPEALSTPGMACLTESRVRVRAGSESGLLHTLHDPPFPTAGDTCLEPQACATELLFGLERIDIYHTIHRLKASCTAECKCNTHWQQRRHPLSRADRDTDSAFVSFSSSRPLRGRRRLTPKPISCEPLGTTAANPVLASFDTTLLAPRG
ncbi:hypothetical protein B0H14DRAFT_3524227 [Mycena olivaceomarginata]|nr:hypothetical protein B0H14DRAFT_3524227 [Mycena olivaceomarginata]